MRIARSVCVLSLVVVLGAAGGAVAQVNFTNYVALGDSLTAGYASGGLAQFYQEHSYPLILSHQFGMQEFAQPLVSDPGIEPVYELQALHVTSQGVSPVIARKDGLGQPINATYPGIYNNLGIPGARAGDLLTKTGDITKLLTGNIDPATIMYDIVLRDGENPAINQAIGAYGTFYTVWIGNNDVLNAALSGVALDGVTLTPVDTFRTQYTTLLGGLRQARGDAGIVTINIPDVASIPFVTTVKPYLVNPADGSHIPLIGSNGLLTENDFVTLGASSLIAQGIGVPQAAGGTGLPLPEGSVDAEGLHAGVVLRAAEVAAIRTRTNELNAVIAEVSAEFGAEMFDVNHFFSQVVAQGLTVVGAIRLTPAFLTGGIFSYDGVHPQRLGYAVVANELVKFINERFGAAVPQVDLRPYIMGGQSMTTAGADQVIYSLEAFKGMLAVFSPDAKLDRLIPARGVRTRVSSPSRPDVPAERPGIVR